MTGNEKPFQDGQELGVGGKVVTIMEQTTDIDQYMETLLVDMVNKCWEKMDLHTFHKALIAYGMLQALTSSVVQKFDEKESLARVQEFLDLIAAYSMPKGVPNDG